MSPSEEPPRRVLIVGGVAGGASCAARLRRLDERAEIVMFERGPHVSFANCGLPYFVGGVIPREEDLLVSSPEQFRDSFRIEVRTRTEVTAIHRDRRTVTVRDLAGGTEREESYDFLVLSPGAVPVRPPLPGIDLPGIFTLRNVPDSVAIRAWLAARAVRRAVVVGGGFIGLEMAENLLHRGVAVTVVEMLDQVMPPLDAEMAGLVAHHLVNGGVQLALGSGVAGFEAQGDHLGVRTADGTLHEADLVVLAIGVRPETTLARACGLELGPRGGITVDARMRTSDPMIFAVGDAVEVEDWVLGQPTLIPLAGPANRQGRIAADVICGRASQFRGTQGTAICGVLGLTVASTGASEKALRRAGREDFETVYLHPNQHSGYYPGAERMHLKVVFRRGDGLLLGAQGVGFEGVDRRIDVLAMAIQKRGTVFDLEEAELCYAPEYGSAKDAVNFAGMIAAGVLRGDMPLAHWTEPSTADTVFVDVRSEEEFARGHVAGAVNLPVPRLRAELDRLRTCRDVRVYCQVGQRGYLATRILRQHGIPARNLSGGLSSRAPEKPPQAPRSDPA